MGVSSIIDSMTPHDLDLLTSLFTPHNIPKSTMLWTPGAKSDQLYLIESGELTITSSSHTVIETLLPGTMVGELEMLSERSRVTYCVASEDCVLWCVEMKALETLPVHLWRVVVRVALGFDYARFLNLITTVQ
jgi:CRP-like cAMP-binding protein